MNRLGTGRHAALLFFAFIIAMQAARSCGNPSPSTNRESTPVRNPIQDLLRPPASVQYREGIAVAVLVDTSGSMKDRVQDADGTRQPKIRIAQRAALNLVKQFDSYAREHTDKTILLGLYEFSNRDRGPNCRTLVQLGPPDPVAAQSAISRMTPSGGTPIGDAMITAKHDLDAAALSKQHILVITDGENNAGYSPVDVTRIIANESAEARASIYFVAFDVAAEKFNGVRDSGGLILAASNEKDLNGTLDYLLTGKILAEQPVSR
jgi:von Willebrand factor type A domain